MELSYYPGCTLKTKASNFEDSAIASMEALGINLVELQRWNCCGTVYSLAEDDLVHHIAPVRTLIRVKEQGLDRVVTLCSFCYNTLKRANLLIKNSAEKRNTLNSFMTEEIDYDGSVEVTHLLSVLRDDLGWKSIAEKVTNPLTGLKIAAYYGCTLLRPQEAAIDDVERPRILEDLIETVGATGIDFPFAAECCSSFQAVSNADVVAERAYAILNNAQKQGAEAIIVSCPLCSYNLGQHQEILMQQHHDFTGMPILYFTQLLSIALGLDRQVCRFELNPGRPLELLRAKGLVD
ncbi:CoB--CoM heterodisulfide reductase iron-sulfur subunit B family protein [Chloroflexota bacterium]